MRIENRGLKIATTRNARQRSATRHPRSSVRQTGFTLIELLTVILIIMILAGLVAGIARVALLKAHTSRAKAEVGALDMAVENFRVDKGYYPRHGPTRSDNVSNSGSLLAALTTGPRKYFLPRPSQTNVVGGVLCIVDPFGTPYNYFTNRATFDVWSYGPDLQSSDPTNRVDDITN
jgi:general secretion pathway protein G